MYTALDEIKEIFISIGFTVLDGPEVELATYNFDKLNAGEGHPPGLERPSTLTRTAG